MINCARSARKKPNVLFASASTHLRLRFLFVSPPLRHPATPSRRHHRKRFHPPAHPSILPLTSSHPHYVRRRYHLHLVKSPSSHLPKRYYVAHARVTSSTLDAVRGSRSIPSFSFFFNLKSPTRIV